MQSSIPLRVKIEGALHLTAYLVHLLILFLLLLAVPMSLSHSSVLRWTPLLMLAAVGPPLLYVCATTSDGVDWRARFKLVAGLVVLGIGLSFNNSRATLAGLLLPGRGNFERTPKFALRHAKERWERSWYALKPDRWVWAEILLVVFALVNIAFAGASGYWGFIPWLIVYSVSFGFVAGITIWQTARQRAFARGRTRLARRTLGNTSNDVRAWTREGLTDREE